ncbi:unnamed protein product (macronuclear) [Paramecium tetraurelia]|uniref:PARG catalytic Macro domain-containing protein n=1 Tax=Paramecium tetraurelia TaxID=5888 RepID=A0CGB1_PARTE|nr:uncharacterized protein GSPATT00038273001 [Paramecium tetraurelia]CAK69828.1 unnamed protein product [Paramecium tetraurelia]|eukprot:XP_001437225.1 hypothetical protein (macronuclear) [Paramecium tetraurelia strain d4-2]
MIQGDQDFECHLVEMQLNDQEYQNLVDKEETFIQINKQDSGFCNYLRNDILNDKTKLKQLLNRINNQWNQNFMVELKREEIFTLIILMFLNQINRKQQFGGFYIINMENLKRTQIRLCTQKMRCIENYLRLFYRNKDNLLESSFDNNEKVQFKNQVVKFIKNIQEVEFSFNEGDQKSKLNISINVTNQRNEDQKNSTVVDFADQNIGGLTLDSYNCAQEEILMLIFPEALVTMIFIPPMKDNEAVLITNLKKFSKYSGYEQSFICKEQEDLEKNFFNMLAIDAKPFSRNIAQFKKQNLDREIRKCYSGFSLALKYQPNNDISTGRWGCGIFGGNQYLKTMIQLICFAQAKYETENSTAKLIINASNTHSLITFVNDLKQYEQIVNLQNLTILIQELSQRF